MCQGDSTNVTHTVGTLVWIADKAETWIKGKVEKVVGDKISVKTENNEVKEVKPEDAPL